jgi:hypothetical protein
MRSQLAWQDNCLLTADSSFSFPSSTKSNFLGTAAQEHFCTGKKVSHELSIDQNYGISRSALGRARCPCSNRVTGVKTKTLCASPRFESIGIQSRHSCGLSREPPLNQDVQFCHERPRRGFCSSARRFMVLHWRTCIGPWKCGKTPGGTRPILWPSHLLGSPRPPITSPG